MSSHMTDIIEANLAARTLPAAPGAAPRSWLDLAADVAREVGVEIRASLRSRQKTFAKARHLAWIKLRGFGYSFPEIGAGWGVDHTTVMSACGTTKRSVVRSQRARFPVRLVVVGMGTARKELRLLRGGKTLDVLGSRTGGGRWLLDALHARRLAAVLPAIERRCTRREAA
jgi:hypothetical protein